jgi:hypothetical protein
MVMKLTQNLLNIIKMIIEHCTQVRKTRPLVKNDYKQMLKSFLPELLKFDLSTAETLLFISFIGSMDDDYFNGLFAECNHDNNALFELVMNAHLENYPNREKPTDFIAFAFAGHNLGLELQTGLIRLGIEFE